MRWVVFFIAAIFISNCHTTKKTGFDSYNMNEFCTSVLNDLEKRVYRIDKEYYGLKLYATTYKERVDEFFKLAMDVNYEISQKQNDCMGSLTSGDIISHFGKPNSMNKRQNGSVSVLYRFNFGGNKCPCKNCLDSEKYDECNIIAFEFGSNGRLSNINMSNLAHSLK